jgi:hypothetical protein
MRTYALVFDFRPHFAESKRLIRMSPIAADTLDLPDAVRRLVRERLDQGHDVWVVQARLYSTRFVQGLKRAWSKDTVLLVGPELDPALRRFMDEHLTVRDLPVK